MTSQARTWIGYIAMCIGMFMAILDIQVVASSLTNIQHALNIPDNKISWIQTAYLMAEVIAIPLTGMLTRALSLRWMFVTATAGFTLASIGCALCTGADPLIALRVVQGFCGGMLIPAVFTSVFTILPKKNEILATAMAGVVAMIAPTVGPFVGGWLTQTYSWHWIFLINVVPGVFVCLVAGIFLPMGGPDSGIFRKIDYATVLLAAIFLGTLELLLKEAPPHHWSGLYIYSLFTICAASGSAAGYLCLSRPFPFVDLTRFSRTSFAVGCSLSFVAGMGLYGSTYILAIFLGGVREHTPIEIGEIIMVSGAVQLLAAPVAALSESRIDGRLLLAFGYALFGIGLLINGQMTYETDFDGLFWPQVLRGVAVMFCILPTTRLAMEGWNTEAAPDASGQFNLMRNLGGAIGIALIDTILAQRAPEHAKHIIARLQAGDPLTAAKVGLPTEYFHGVPMGPVDPSMRAYVEPLIQRAALVDSFNEAWIVLGVLFVLSLVAVLFVRGGTWQPGRASSETDD
ncbi:MAG TPA: DHA2 family efflux MFS transporter permease subunit [Rhizomicrobium sp.]|nr:DHA2 family efflux MFS transporter permease subunit [Rhizomicrobium sp.]